ncbi:FUSC family protein, partial [Streptomyces werraensis]
DVETDRLIDTLREDVIPAAGVDAHVGGVTAAAAVVDLRATADAAAGEWWQRALPQERVVLAEQAAHRTLAATVRRQGLLPGPGTTSTYTHTEGASP